MILRVFGFFLGDEVVVNCNLAHLCVQERYVLIEIENSILDLLSSLRYGSLQVV